MQVVASDLVYVCMHDLDCLWVRHPKQHSDGITIQGGKVLPQPCGGCLSRRSDDAALPQHMNGLERLALKEEHPSSAAVLHLFHSLHLRRVL